MISVARFRSDDISRSSRVECAARVAPVQDQMGSLSLLNSMVVVTAFYPVQLISGPRRRPTQVQASPESRQGETTGFLERLELLNVSLQVPSHRMLP